MIHATNLPKNLWGEVVMHAVWLKNHIFIWRLGAQTPYDVLYKSKPSLVNVLAWGCPVNINDPFGMKLNLQV